MMSEYRFLPLRSVRPGGNTVDRYDLWLARLAEELADPGTNRDEFCHRVPREIYFPGDRLRAASRTRPTPSP